MRASLSPKQVKALGPMVVALKGMVRGACGPRAGPKGASANDYGGDPGGGPEGIARAPVRLLQHLKTLMAMVVTLGGGEGTGEPTAGTEGSITSGAHAGGDGEGCGERCALIEGGFANGGHADIDIEVGALPLHCMKAPRCMVEGPIGRIGRGKEARVVRPGW